MTELSMHDGWERELSNSLDDRDRYRLLAVDLRRIVLEAIADLRSSTDETTLGELASAVDRRSQRRAETDDAPNDDLLVDLHHVHLPLLDEVGVVEYRASAKRVRLDGGTVDVPLPDEHRT